MPPAASFGIRRTIQGGERLDIYGLTDAGKVRTNNEDYFLLNEEKGVFVIADGMGGHNGGEIASRIAVESFWTYVQSELHENSVIAQVVCNGIRQANREVFKKAQSDKTLRGMGTTMDVCFFKDAQLITFHVGDSRIYRFRGGTLQQLTTDHSFVEHLIESGEITREEAAVHPNRNVITRAVGSEPTVLIDVAEHEVASGDRYFMCTDGLSNLVSDSEIAEVLNSNIPLKEQAERLISIANEKGGTDNSTVLIIEI